MKKILLTAALAVMTIGAQAQDWNKGDFFVGAKTTSLDFGVKTYEGSSVTNFNLGVEGGYFFTDKLAADAALGFDSTCAKPKGGTKVSDNAFAFGVGVRYYPISNLYARVGFEGLSKKGVDGLASYAGVEVGYDFFLGENVFVTPGVYYSKGLNKDIDQTNNFGLAARFGFRF